VVGLTQEQKDHLWADINYGFSKVTTVSAWMKAHQMGIESDMATILTNHFYLTKRQTSEILAGLDDAITAASDTLVNTFNCPDKHCTSKHLIAVQWASQNVTQGVPISSIPPKPSITFINETVFGYPEFSYYYTEVFLKDHKEEEYQGITMDLETALRLTDIVTPGEVEHSIEQSLGDQYNLAFVFNHGYLYDISHDLKDLQPVMDKLQLKSLPQTRVLWEYLKYMRSDFATMGDKVIDGAAKSQVGTFISKFMKNITTRFIWNYQLK